MKYGEIEAIKKFDDQITIKQYGRDCFIYHEPEQADIDAARAGFEEVRDIIASGEYQLVIMDEANIATYYRLFSVDELLELIDGKPDGVELVITGRMADKKIIDRADLVTEMKEVKHYFNDGIQARKGIEM
jgi:cob(I)alamin adenosyltransferase